MRTWPESQFDRRGHFTYSTGDVEVELDGYETAFVSHCSSTEVWGCHECGALVAVDALAHHSIWHGTP